MSAGTLTNLTEEFVILLSLKELSKIERQTKSRPFLFTFFLIMHC
jgi:hypothetical protein